ncbi:MAG: TIGR04053 family radical SAM/SPASM domain-containing protein [Halobacteriaceae archaeon]
MAAPPTVNDVAVHHMAANRQAPVHASAPMRPAAVETSDRPFVLIWEVTQACDLECKHCRADATPDRDPAELSTAEARQFLEDVREFGEDQLLVLSGGDPLARDDTIDLVEYGTDIGLQMTLTPSGTASLTPETVQALADADLRRMAVSLDGPTPSTHDEFRQEPGSFEQTLRAARAAQAAGLPLQVNTTVCAETVEYLPALRDVVATLDAVLWSVFFLVPVGRGTELDPISPTHAERVMEYLCEVAAEADFGVKTTEAPHYRRVATQRDQDATAGPAPDAIGRSAGINAGDGFAFVSHRGDLYPSGFLPMAVGNVREDHVVDLYRETDLFQSLRDPDALGGKCGACPYRGLCGGSRSRAYAYTGDPLAADPLCAYVPPDYDGPVPGPAHQPQRANSSE